MGRGRMVPDVPYKTSEVSAVDSSAWMQHYRESSGPKFARGLMTQDPRYSTEQSAGVCVLKQDALPPMPRSNPAISLKEANIRYINAALRDLGVNDAAGAPGETNDNSASGSEISAMRRSQTCSQVARGRYHKWMYAKEDPAATTSSIQRRSRGS